MIDPDSMLFGQLGRIATGQEKENEARLSNADRMTPMTGLSSSIRSA